MVDGLEGGQCNERAACFATGYADADKLGRLSPSSADAPIFRARLLFAERGVAPAAEHLEGACERFGAWERARCFAEIVKLSVKSQEIGDRRSTRAAMSAAEACHDSNGGCGPLMVELAGLLARGGARATAFALYERAILIEPSVDGLLGLAEAALALEQFGRAQRALEHASQLSARDPVLAEQVRGRKETVLRKMVGRSVGLP